MNWAKGHASGVAKQLVLLLDSIPLAFVQQTPVNWSKGHAAGTQLKLRLSSGQTWLIFTSTKAHWEYDNMVLTMTRPFTGVVRAAVLLQPEVRGWQ